MPAWLDRKMAVCAEYRPLGDVALSPPRPHTHGKSPQCRGLGMHTMHNHMPMAGMLDHTGPPLLNNRLAKAATCCEA